MNRSKRSIQQILRPLGGRCSRQLWEFWGQYTEVRSRQFSLLGRFLPSHHPSRQPPRHLVRIPCPAPSFDICQGLEHGPPQVRDAVEGIVAHRRDRLVLEQHQGAEGAAVVVAQVHLYAAQAAVQLGHGVACVTHHDRSPPCLPRSAANARSWLSLPAPTPLSLSSGADIPSLYLGRCRDPLPACCRSASVHHGATPISAAPGQSPGYGLRRRLEG